MQVESTRLSRTAGKRRRRRRPAAPVRPGNAEDEADGHIVERKALGPEEGAVVLTLVVANRFRMWADCPHQACRRARACSGDDMVCVAERRGELKRKILEEVVLLLATVKVSSDEFYDYLDEVSADADEACNVVDG